MLHRFIQWLFEPITKRIIFEVTSEVLRRIPSSNPSLESRIDTQLLAVARLLAKIEPTFAESEFDPDRKRRSDLMTEEIIRKLIAEAAMHNQQRKLYGG